MTRLSDNVIKISDLLGLHARRAELAIQRLLISDGVPDPLADAMRYCVLGGGKRIRPAVVYMAAQAAGADDEELVDRAAVAVELVHCYSLVHDDLPMMDDDALRRGRPTAHVKFSDAMAILAGDALLTRAMGVLGEADYPQAGRLVAELAAGAGAAGMIAGQVADMDLCPAGEGMEKFRFINLRKTAALIRAAARMGAICGDADEEVFKAMVDNFKQRLPKDYSKMAEKVGLSYYQAITLAAMIEKETGRASERKVISSVFHNRLKKKMKLQSDPTVVYGLKNYSGQ